MKNQPNFNGKVVKIWVDEKKFAAPLESLAAPLSAAAHSLKTTDFRD
jgi:hypothetical protein